MKLITQKHTFIHASISFIKILQQRKYLEALYILIYLKYIVDTQLCDFYLETIRIQFTLWVIYLKYFYNGKKYLQFKLLYYLLS